MTWYDIIQLVSIIILAIFAIVFGIMTIIVSKRPPRIIYVEDGSLSGETINDLEDKGYMVVIYRQGSRLPEVQK